LAHHSGVVEVGGLVDDMRSIADSDAIGRRPGAVRRFHHAGAARRNNQVADAHQHFGLCDRRTFDDLDEVGWRADLQTSLAHDLDDRRGCPPGPRMGREDERGRGITAALAKPWRDL
jgi:hypothetical protein